MTSNPRLPAAGDPDIAARLAQGRLEEVPAEAVRAGLRLPLHDYLGIELTGLRPAALEIPLTDRTRSLTGPLHGGVVATLADVAAGVAAATSGAVDITRYGLTTARLEADNRAQPNGDRIRAEAEVAEIEHRTIRVECVVTDGDERRVATALVVVRVLARGGFTETDLGR